MPIYEYQCRSCGRRSEEFQKMSDPPLTECSECGGELRKLISAPAVQFKGSGWYVTDYAKSGASKPADTSSGGSGASAASGDASGGGESSGGDSKSSGDGGDGASGGGAKKDTASSSTAAPAAAGSSTGASGKTASGD